MRMDVTKHVSTRPDGCAGEAFSSSEQLSLICMYTGNAAGAEPPTKRRLCCHARGERSRPGGEPRCCCAAEPCASVAAVVEHERLEHLANAVQRVLQVLRLVRGGHAEARARQQQRRGRHAHHHHRQLREQNSDQRGKAPAA